MDDDLSSVLGNVAADARPTTRYNHPRVRGFLKVRYEQWIVNWAEIYAELAELYNLQLRPDYTWHDVAELIDAVMEGARVRARSTGTMVVLSSGETVVVGAIFAMLSGLLVDFPARQPVTS